MKRKKIHIHISKLAQLSIAVIALGVVGIVYAFGIASPVRQMTTFRVSRGASVASVANGLVAANLISSPDMFKFAVRAHGGKIQSGEYDVPRGTSVWRMAHILARGRVATTTIVIPEGMTIRQIKNQLLADASLSGAVECSAPGAAAVCNLRDGDVFPDTYRVARGTARLAVLDLARQKMNTVHENWIRAGRRAPKPLANWNDVLTLASIVQKETPRESEMPIVASVYLNRLRKNMRLQADPTVVYALTGGLGDMQGAALLRGHLRVDSPYNTYTHGGLPPAPIANVGLAAIRAVLNPADTNYLYFVADGRGGHRFSNSYSEHQRNHADWRQIKKLRNGK